MSIEPDKLRESLGLADDDLQLSPEDAWNFNMNDRYHTLLDPHARQLSQLMVGRAVQYYEVGPQFTSDRSFFRALVAPQDQFEKPQTGEVRDDDPVTRWRFVTSLEEPRVDGYWLRTQSDFVIDRPVNGAMKLAWSERSRYSVLSDKGKHEWPWEPSSLPSIERTRESRMLQAAQLTIRLSVQHEANLMKPEIDIAAAAALSRSLDRFSEAFAVPIADIKFRHYS